MMLMNSLHYQVERFLRGVRFHLSRRLPTCQPPDVWPGIEAVRVQLAPFSGRFGNVKRYELLVLCAVVKHTQALRIFEFGTFDGRTTLNLAVNAGARARLWTLDLPVDLPANHPARSHAGYSYAAGKLTSVSVGAHFRGTPEAQQIEQIYCDSLQFNPEPFRGSMDFCFIDAGHGYEHVSRDTKNALVMVRPGGTIMWHDYSRWWPGVQRCLDELSIRLPVFRVAETSLAALQVPVRA